MPVHESWRNIGSRIRRLRKLNRLTIKQLAVGCDLSPNAISLVERGEVAPSVATLCKIARALGVSASALFQEICSPEVVVHRAGLPTQDAVVSSAIQSMTCSLSPKTERKTSALFDEEEEIVSRSAARQSLLCLSGAVIFEVDDQTYCLKPGDTITFNGSAYHRWRNPEDAVSVAVVVIPPHTPTE
jgi:transcriptional regulator with XRE-family HTH domain